MITRSNQEWLSALRAKGEKKDTALSDLRTIVVKGLPFALSKWIDQSDPRFAPLIEEVAQETILRVLEKLDTFEGRSQFTTWVHVIAVRIALTELRRAKWREISLEEILARKDVDDEPLELHDQKTNVEDSVQKNELMAVVQEAIDHSLTEKQRTALLAVAVHGVPMEEVARKLNTNRNALYKLLHDARLKLKKYLQKQGTPFSDILKNFGN